MPSLGAVMQDEIDALRAENARLLATSVRLHKERDDLAIEVARLEGLVLEAEADIKAMGIEAHPAVLMRLDRLIRRIRGEKP